MKAEQPISNFRAALAARGIAIEIHVCGCGCHDVWVRSKR